MNNIQMEMRAKLVEMGLHFLCMFVDVIFLCLWASVNFVADRVIKLCRLEGADSVVGLVLQSLFGVATLIPIAIFIYRDITLMWIRTVRRIAKVR